MASSVDRAGAAEAQRAMMQVRKSVNAVPLQFLSAEQRMVIDSVLSQAERRITQSLEANVEEPFRFNDLPGEIKNKIYAKLVVSDDIIKPVLSNTRNGRAYGSHHSCGGQILSTSSTSYREAMTMLLGYNVFELTPSLCDFLGRDLRHEQPYHREGNNLISYKDRLAMVQFASIAVHDLSTMSRRAIISRLPGLKKLIIFNASPGLKNEYLPAPATSTNWQDSTHVEFLNNNTLQQALSWLWWPQGFPHDVQVYYAVTKYTSNTPNYTGRQIPVSYFRSNWKIEKLTAQPEALGFPAGTQLPPFNLTSCVVDPGEKFLPANATEVGPDELVRFSAGNTCAGLEGIN